MSDIRNGDRNSSHIRAVVVTAMLSAVAFVLMFLDFSITFLITNFVKMDFSELPALLAAFALGPVWGAVVCLVKNLIHLMITTTAGAGELANFLLGVCFVVPAGLIYRGNKNRRRALVGVLVGALCMAALSIPINYFITYPVYSRFLPIDAILGMYQKLRPSVNGLLEGLVNFNAPCNVLKGVLTAVLCFLIYKPLSPILHGKGK